jgi:AcrR family transcriptional regulator
MERRRQRRPPRGQVVHDLLDAAARLVAERGFEAASVAAICEEAGYSTGAVYSNFNGKEDLFLRLYEERIERRSAELRATVRAAGGGVRGLAAAGANWSQEFAAGREWFLLYFEFALKAARDPEFAARFQTLREQAMEELESGIEQALAEAGAGSSIPSRELARMIRAVNYGFALDRLIDEASVPESIPGDLIVLLIRAVSGEHRGTVRSR